MLSKGNITVAYPKDGLSERLASRLLKRITGYRIPLDVRRRKGIRSLKDIRDKWLIVCCTPETKDDGEVLSLISEYVSEGLSEHVLTVLMSGKPEESFPEILRFRKHPDGTVEEIEPLAANLTGDFSRRRLNTESLRLFAPMLGVSFDELNRRDLKRKMKWAILAGAAVIMFSAAFLFYSVNKKEIINDQNIELRTQYDIRKKAEGEMVREKDEAVYQNRLLLSRKAREAFDSYDMQQALMYCLEALDKDDPDSLIDEMRDVFENALTVSCSSGYVPITSRKAYFGMNESNRNYIEYSMGGFEKSFTEELSGEACEYIEEKEGISIKDRKPVGEFNLKGYSERYGYAVYYCYFKKLDMSRSYGFTKVCFRDDPGRDYYLKDSEGEFLGLYGAFMAFENGKFISQLGNHDTWYEFDALTGEMKEAFLYESDEDRYRKCSPNVSCSYTDDRKYIVFIEHRSDTLEVYAPETGRRIYMETAPWINANSHSHYTLDDGRSFELFIMSKAYIYETGTGKLTEFSSDDSSIESVAISAEGYVAVEGERRFTIYDLESGEIIAEIPNTSTNSFDETMFIGKPGKYNSVYGAEIFGSGQVIFEYHEDAVPVPEDFAERVELTEKLLEKRLQF